MRNRNDRKSNVENNHPKHPVRNFFYVLYSLFNALAFIAFFYSIYAVELSARLPLLILSGGVCVLAFVFGVVRPWAQARR